MFGWNGPVTHRQYLAWQAWLDLQWNCPSRSDYYTMGVACEVRRVLNKKPASVLHKHFLLKFDRKGGSHKRQLTREEAASVSKAKWFGLFGMKPVEHPRQQLPDDVSGGPPSPAPRPFRGPSQQDMGS